MKRGRHICQRYNIYKHDRVWYIINTYIYKHNTQNILTLKGQDTTVRQPESLLWTMSLSLNFVAACHFF